jgi:hypothetical protein
MKGFCKQMAEERRTSLYTKELNCRIGDINSKLFKFTPLDGSSGLHISKSTVSTSYTFRQKKLW